MTELERLKRDLGSLTFSAQYRRPPRSDRLPRQALVVSIVRSRAAQPSFNDDRAKLGYGPQRRYKLRLLRWDDLGEGRQHYYLLDLVRTCAAYPQLVQTVKRSIDDHDPDIVLIEDVGSGTSLIADLDYQGLSTTPVKARMGKESRLSRVSAMMEKRSPAEGGTLGGRFPAGSLSVPRSQA